MSESDCHLAVEDVAGELEEGLGDEAAGDEGARIDLVIVWVEGAEDFEDDLEREGGHGRGGSFGDSEGEVLESREERAGFCCLQIRLGTTQSTCS